MLSGGIETVSSGGLISGSPGAGTVILGGTLNVLSGGTAEYFDISRGVANVSAGAGADNVTVASGGTLNVRGMITGNAAVLAGGVENVSSGGLISGSPGVGTVISGGTVNVRHGGMAQFVDVSSGGALNVSGRAGDTAIFGGGLEHVLSGGVVSGVTISGGTLELGSGAVVSGPIEFAGRGGTLRIDAATMPTNVISGLVAGDMIDLAGASFISGGTVSYVHTSSSSVLEVIEGGKTFDLQLDPSQNLTGLPFVLAADGHGGTEIFASDFPGVALGINDAGQIVGYANGEGFLYSNGSFTALNGFTLAGSINDKGQIVGYAVAGFAEGVLYSNGTYTTFNDPFATSDTNAFGINNAGQIVGYYSGSGGTHGFLYDPSIGPLTDPKAWTTLDDPLVDSSQITTAFGINNTGEVVGTYYNDGQHGFLYAGGNYTTIDDPLGTFTQLDGINDAGQIVGEFYYNGNWHGFLYSNGTYTTLDNPAGAGQFGTVITGINNIGTLVGTYDDSNGTEHGFVITPQTANITNNNTSVALSGDYAMVTTSATNDAVVINGDYGSVTDHGAGNTITLNGSFQSVTVRGAGNDTIAINGNDGAIFLSNNNDVVATLTGNNDTVLFESQDNDTLTLSNNAGPLTIASANHNDAVVFAGNGGTVIMTPGDTLDYTAVGATIDIKASNATVNLSGDNDVLTIGGNLSITRNDTVNITGASDSVTLSANSGNDLFNFGSAISGKDVISGFDSSDVIQFNISLFANFSAVMSAASQTGAGVVITDPNNQNNTITLADVPLADLQQSNFKFV